MSEVTLGKLVSVAVAAEKLGLASKSLIVRYIKQGRLRATQVPGRIWMIDADSLEQFSKTERRAGNPNFGKKPC